MAVLSLPEREERLGPVFSWLFLGKGLLLLRLPMTPTWHINGICAVSCFSLWLWGQPTMHHPHSLHGHVGEILGKWTMD